MGNTFKQLLLNLEYFGDIFDLWFIGSVGFNDYLTDKSLASILFASAGSGAGCSAGEKKLEAISKNSFLSQFISRRHRTD